MHELFDGVTVSPVIEDIRQIRNDCGDPRGSERLSQIPVPDARTREAVRDDGHLPGRFGAGFVDVYVDLVTSEFEHVATQNESCGLGRGGGTDDECDRQRKPEQAFKQA